MGFLRNRFSEPSTWAGLMGILLANPAALAGDKSAMAAVVAGAVAVLLPENIRAILAGK